MGNYSDGNVVPPGVNEAVFFPDTRQEGRLWVDRLDHLLFTETDPASVFGTLEDPSKRLLFSIARLDRIKNLTGLAKAYGKSKALQEHCNLILVAGKRTLNLALHDHRATFCGWVGDGIDCDEHLRGFCFADASRGS